MKKFGEESGALAIENGWMGGNNFQRVYSRANYTHRDTQIHTHFSKGE